MKHILLVFIGGGIGSALRYIISLQINKTSLVNLPLGSLLVNVVGSFLIGIFIGLALKNSSLASNQTLFLTAGFCGGFTTFSAFAFENQMLLKNGDYMTFALYTIASISLTILAVFLGLWLVKGT